MVSSTRFRTSYNSSDFLVLRLAYVFGTSYRPIIIIIIIFYYEFTEIVVKNTKKINSEKRKHLEKVHSFRRSYPRIKVSGFIQPSINRLLSENSRHMCVPSLV